MKKPIKVCVVGLGHPEGPFELDDRRVIYANTYASEIGVWDPSTGKSGTFAKVGGGPNACVLGSDGCVYSTQTPNVGTWTAPIHRPPSIQKARPDGSVGILVTEADGVKFDGPNDLAFGPDGRLYFTDSGDWAPETKPHPGRIIVVEKNGEAHILEELANVYPNGIVVEPDGSIVWVESYTLKVIRRAPDGRKQVIHEMPEGHIPDGLKIDAEGNFWITAVAAGGVDVIDRDGKPLDFLETGGTILNCAFGSGGALYCCDMGPFDVTGVTMTGRLIRVDVGVEGMTPFRGAIGEGEKIVKIVKVEAIPVSYPEPNDFNALRHLCLAKITADDGQVGWGELITQFPEANFAAKAIIEGMAPNLIGKDPVHTETLWRQNKQQAWWYGYHGGIASYAVAAIDIALWDLKGKALGKSVLDLLGGPVHDRLPAIASCHAHYASIPEMAEETAEWVSTGLQGLKTGFGKRGDARLGYDHDRDVAYVKAMREVLGDKLLMIDNGIAIKWDVTDAVRRAKAMEEYNLDWIEEPLGAWDPEGYANLRAKTTTRIAYGEREWTLEQFERVLATGTVDVVGVDPGRAEGITGFKQIAQRCEFYRRQANAHAWSSAIVSAASLAISFNSPACKLFELKPLRNPMQHDLVTKPFEHVEGWVYPPTGPGLGIEVIESVVDSFRSERVLSR